MEEEILQLAKQINLDDVKLEDLMEIVQETTASLSNDDLKKITEQK